MGLKGKIFPFPTQTFDIQFFDLQFLNLWSLIFIWVRPTPRDERISQDLCAMDQSPWQATGNRASLEHNHNPPLPRHEGAGCKHRKNRVSMGRRTEYLAPKYNKPLR